MTPTEVCNLALAEQGQRVQITALNDGSPAGNAAALFYMPKIQMLHRVAPWDFARAQATLTVWKQAIVNGVVNTANPPPQPWLYSYLWPSDCLKARFLQPTLPTAQPTTPPLTSAPTQVIAVPPVPTAIPFVPGTDFDANGNPIRVILTNVPQAQLIYVRDLSQYPDQWDSLFLSAGTALLSSYFINALFRNAAQYAQAVATTKNMIDQARLAAANEQVGNVDHTPDWIRARRIGGVNWSWANGGPGAPGSWWALGGWDSCGFPDGTWY